MAPYIVLLDPEPLTETAISRALRLAGFHVTVVDNEAAARRVVATQGADALIVADPPGRPIADGLRDLQVPILALDSVTQDRLLARIAGDQSQIVARVRALLAIQPCAAA